MRSQEDICIGKKQSLHSAVLNEERNYWIHLPAGYEQDTTKRYPVIYLLDGDAFHSLVGISRTFYNGQRQIPPGKHHHRRAQRRPDTRPDADSLGSGTGTAGLPRMRLPRRRKRNIQPLPDRRAPRRYRQHPPDERKEYADRPFLRGTVHLNTFLRHTELFDTYLAVDPSLW